MFRRFPYTNFHELNSDWLVERMLDVTNKVKELTDIVNNKIELYVKQYVEENLSKFAIEAYYDEANTAIRIELREE